MIDTCVSHRDCPLLDLVAGLAVCGATINGVLVVDTPAHRETLHETITHLGEVVEKLLTPGCDLGRREKVGEVVRKEEDTGEDKGEDGRCVRVCVVDCRLGWSFLGWFDIALCMLFVALLLLVDEIWETRGGNQIKWDRQEYKYNDELKRRRYEKNKRIKRDITQVGW